jgi:hypothetical protein
MKESLIDGDRAVVANDQPTVVSEPGEGAFHDPATTVAAQRPAILGLRFASIAAMRGDQFDASRCQSGAQRIAVIAAVANDTLRFLAGPSTATPACYPDRGDRFFGEPSLVGGSRVKLLSQRNTLAVDHHHPLRALAPLGFSDFRAPFFAGAKLPSRNDSLQSSCLRSFSSAKKARQMVSQICCSSQSRSRLQQVAGEGNSSGKSCQRAPLRKTQSIPSRTLRSFARGRPPCRDLRGFGSKGAIFSHWASVSRRPYRAIEPPSALLNNFISHFRQINYHWIRSLYPVLK